MKVVSPPIPRANPERITFLDGLRGLATLIVLLVHATDQVLPAFIVFRERFLQVGNIGVVVFFFCSGFIIPATLERHGSLRRFWGGRVWRLFPVYWLSCALASGFVVAGWWSLPSFATRPLATIVANITMTQLFTGVSYLNSVFWTLELELVFYAMVSAAWWLGLLRYRVIIAAALLVANGLVQLMLPQASATSPALAYLVYIALMWVGTVAYQYHCGVLAGRTMVGIALLTLASLIAPMVPHGVTGFSPYAFAHLAGFLLTAALFVRRASPSPAGLRWLGLVSYSLYVLHSYVLSFGQALPVFVILPIWIGVSLSVAAAAEFGIERPAMRLGRRLMAGRARGDMAPAEPMVRVSKSPAR